MSQASLRTVTLETVANYGRAAERAIHAYRTGGHRLIALMQRSVDRAATRGAERVAPRIADAIRRASNRVGTIAIKGLDAVSSSTERALELGKAGVTAQVMRVAEIAESIDNRALAGSLQAAAKLSLPGAQAARAMSERVVASADTMYGAIAGRRTAKPQTRRAATAPQKAKKAARKVVRSARKAAAEAIAPKAPRARRAPRTAVSTEAASA
jgi:hypothetical protein